MFKNYRCGGATNDTKTYVDKRTQDLAQLIKILDGAEALRRPRPFEEKFPNNTNTVFENVLNELEGLCDAQTGRINGEN